MYEMKKSIKITPDKIYLKISNVIGKNISFVNFNTTEYLLNLISCEKL